MIGSWHLADRKVREANGIRSELATFEAESLWIASVEFDTVLPSAAKLLGACPEVRLA